MPRVVSLVPSLTETALGLGLSPHELVGRTSFCVRPQPIVRSIRVMGGTKTPRLQRILDLRPDLVLMDRDENRVADAQVLEDAGIELFVADLAGLDDVEGLLVHLGERLGHEQAGRSHAHELAQARARAQSAAPHSRPRAAALVWHEPLMAVAPDCYCGALLREAGFEVPSLGEGRYPPCSLDALAAANLDLLLLPDEPHRFTAAEGEQLQGAIAARGRRAPAVHHTDGQDLFWYGVRSAGALASLADLARRVQGLSP